jgi:hypothetical protein
MHSYYYGERYLCAGGSCKSSPQAENRVHLRPHYVHLRKKRIKRRKEPVWRSSTALRAYPDDRLVDGGGTLPRFVERGDPRKPIITIPLTLYGFGNGDDANEGCPERRRDGREHGEHKADKARRCSRSTEPLRDRRRDMLQLHPAAALLSPRARGPRPACAGRSPRAGA